MSVFFINPFAFAAADGDYESIATVTVGSGGAANIEFTSIPGTYQHLQVRGVGRTDRSGGSNDQLRLQLNSDTGSNYAVHFLYGTGSTAGAEGYTGQTSLNAYDCLSGPTAPSSVFGAAIIDILDYSSTSKNKVMRSFSGLDTNGGFGWAAISSGLWLSTSAVTSIKLIKLGNNFVQHTTYALYGIKAP